MIAAYRRVYYGAPASGKADPSVFAVAELLAEMGRAFNNESALHAAIGQYKFLRREYPGSRDRFEALFNIGQIYQDDLKDPAQAKPVFEEFLRRYPRNHLADDARQGAQRAGAAGGLKVKGRERRQTTRGAEGEPAETGLEQAAASRNRKCRNPGPARESRRHL